MIHHAQVFLASALILAGCTAQPVATARYDAKAALLTADNIALAYLAQPPCAGPVQITCVDASVKARIKAASARASVARKTVDAAIALGQVADVASFEAAVAAFSAVVAPYSSIAK